jgi:hypothetical protein
VAQGVALMRQGIETHEATGAFLGLPAYLADLAAACIAMGDLDQAAAAIERGHRIGGDLLLARGRATAAAEMEYLEGLRIANRQSQWLYALRSATALARLWVGDGRATEARDVVASALGAFPQGEPGAPELLSAQAILREIRTARLLPPALLPDGPGR